VTNRVSVPLAQQDFHFRIVNQIPRPVCWLDGKEYKGLTNLRFFPAPAKVVTLKAGTDPGSRVVARQTWQCEAQPELEWEWEINGRGGTDVLTTCQFEVVTAERRLRTEKLHLTLADFERVPPHLWAATAQIRAALPSGVAQLAKTIAGNEDDPFKMMQRFCDWLIHEIPQSGRTSDGRFIGRYDFQMAIDDRHGWCGPRSAAFRAFCAVYGIPAREVSGFRFANTSGFVANRINGGCAHVWAEVYVPGVGWVEIALSRGEQNVFKVSNRYVPVYGIEAPCAVARDENKKPIPCEVSQTVSLSSTEIQ
jgi:transglutaminase-like putative cysteine protease